MHGWNRKLRSDYMPRSRPCVKRNIAKCLVLSNHKINSKMTFILFDFVFCEIISFLLVRCFIYLQTNAYALSDCFNLHQRRSPRSMRSLSPTMSPLVLTRHQRIYQVPRSLHCYLWTKSVVLGVRRTRLALVYLSYAIHNQLVKDHCQGRPTKHASTKWRCNGPWEDVLPGFPVKVAIMHSRSSLRLQGDFPTEYNCSWNE